MVCLTTSLCPAYCVCLVANDGSLFRYTLLQRVSDWLLFLGIFERRWRLEYPILPLFTHIVGRQ